MKQVSIIFPNQLFRNSPILKINCEILMLEDSLFFGNDKFHKLINHKNKLIFHRASMIFYKKYLEKSGFKVLYINNLNAQRTFVLHGVNVPYQNQENFESQEIEYNSKLAQDYVDSGKMRGWALLKRVSGIGDAEDYKFNYFWVHAFDNIEQMVAHKEDPFWGKFEDKFGFKSSKLKGNGISKSGMYHFMTQDEFNTGQGKYIIFQKFRNFFFRKVIIIV